MFTVDEEAVNVDFNQEMRADFQTLENHFGTDDIVEALEVLQDPMNIMHHLQSKKLD